MSKHTQKTKDQAVICINAGGFFHPSFELIEGKTYLVHDVVVRPSLFGGQEIKFIFIARDGSLIEINTKRFRRLE